MRSGDDCVPKKVFWKEGRTGALAARANRRDSSQAAFGGGWFEVLTANFKTKDSEIDLVFRDDERLVFVEVKARSVGGCTRPAAAVNQSKRALLSKAAAEYVRKLPNSNVKFRFDIVEVLLVDGEVSEVRHLPDAFPLTKAKRHA